MNPEQILIDNKTQTCWQLVNNAFVCAVCSGSGKFCQGCNLMYAHASNLVNAHIQVGCPNCLALKGPPSDVFLENIYNFDVISWTIKNSDKVTNDVHDVQKSGQINQYLPETICNISKIVPDQSEDFADEISSQPDSVS